MSTKTKAKPLATRHTRANGASLKENTFAVRCTDEQLEAWSRASTEAGEESLAIWVRKTLTRAARDTLGR